VYFIPDSIANIYAGLKNYGATIVVPGSKGALHHFEETERSFINQKMGYKVSWPDGWVEDQGLEHTVISQLGWPLNVYAATFIVSKNAGILMPMISIVVENVGDMDIISYSQKRLSICKNAYIGTLDYDIDVCRDFHTVTEIRLYKPSNNLERYQTQKSFIRKNKAYIFNVFDLFPDTINNKPELTTDITKIVHSFTFLENTILSR